MAMVDFQKAQCFFIIPIQAAALIAISAPDKVLAPTSLQQYSNDLYLLGLVGISGMLPVVFTLFICMEPVRSHGIFLECPQ